MTSRPRLLLGAVALALVMSGCRLQLDVNVAMDEDGSGEIEVVVGLDADAVQRIGGDLEARLKVDDLEQAGWTIVGPTKERDGYTRVRVRHPFATPAQANEIFGQIAGDKGPFQDFHLARTSSAKQTEWDFAGRVDFGGGLEAFSDAGVAAQLDGEPLGQTVEELERQLGESVDRLVRVRVGVRLPGEVTSNAAVTAGEAAVWPVQLGVQPLEMRGHGEDQHAGVLIATAVAAVALVLLVLYALVRLVGRFSSRRPRDADGAKVVS